MCQIYKKILVLKDKRFGYMDMFNLVSDHIDERYKTIDNDTKTELILRNINFLIDYRYLYINKKYESYKVNVKQCEDQIKQDGEWDEAFYIDDEELGLNQHMEVNNMFPVDKSDDDGWYE